MIIYIFHFGHGVQLYTTARHCVPCHATICHYDQSEKSYSFSGFY